MLKEILQRGRSDKSETQDLYKERKGIREGINEGKNPMKLLSLLFLTDLTENTLFNIIIPTIYLIIYAYACESMYICMYV